MEEIYNEKELIIEGVIDLSETVAKTFGPQGGTVGLTDFAGNPIVTKDGVTVANAISFKNPIKNFAANLIKQAAARTVEQAGDGTTTSVILAASFFEKGIELNLSYSYMRDEFNKLEDIVLEELFKQSKEITPEKIKDVALISSNGDYLMADIINRAYQHSHFVQIEQASVMDDKLHTVNGMRIEGSLYDKAFINDEKKQAISYDDCYLGIIDGKVREANQLDILASKAGGKPLIIMADHFPESVLNVLKREYNRGALVVGLLKSPSYASNRRMLIKDIINFTKAGQLTAGVYGTTIDKVFADSSFITIGKEEGGVDYLDNLIAAEGEAEENSAEKTILKKRISYLSGKISVVYAGGRSDVEREERAHRMDDAVRAVKSAIEEGVVSGGGLALHTIYNKYKDKNKFIDVINVPYKMLTSRDPNFQVTKHVIDPMKVTRCAVQNAISVAKTLLTTEAVVINDRLWN